MAWQKAVESDRSFGEIWKPSDGDSLEGTLVERKVGVGKNSSNMYVVETKDGGIVSVWGSVVLDRQMADVATGTKIKIDYLGEATNPRTGRTYKDYEVWVEK